MAVACKLHAEDGVVKVIKNRFSHHHCVSWPRFNFLGSSRAVLCREHAESGKVDFYVQLCSHNGCTTRARFDVKGSTEALFCEIHATDCMESTFGRRRYWVTILVAKKNRDSSGGLAPPRRARRDFRQTPTSLEKEEHRSNTSTLSFGMVVLD